MKTYLALGDSYTIGEAVSPEESFPYQLGVALQRSGYRVAKPEIIAKTGWTTDELLSGINTAGLKRKFNLVTLLIGVNNQYRGADIEVYRQEFKILLQEAINFANGNLSGVFVLSIPDWAFTPFGLESGREQGAISAEIDAFNAVNQSEALAAGLSYIDVTTESRLALSDRTLLAADGLHPSGKMYAEWVATLFPFINRAWQ